MTEPPRAEAARWWDELLGSPPFPLATLAISIVVLVIVGFTQGFVFGLIQVALLAVGLGASFTLGHHDESRPAPVRGAFRRMARLYRQLFALKGVVAADRADLGRGEPHADLVQAVGTLELVEFTLTQYLGTIEDAMDDWADLVPEEIDELRRRRGEDDGEEGNDGP